MSPDSSTLSPGTLLGGKYRIEGVLGEGGMGCVYRAVHEEIGLKVAVKHLHKAFTENLDAVERFRREAKLAASIGHDNICQVIDFGTLDDDAPFLVMPRLSGATLGELLAENRALSPERAVDILCQTLSALQAAHDAKIVHRDLKPDNIFITTMGDRQDFVKLLDFGISKIMDHDTVSPLTVTGTMMGTPYYMAPEQAKGAKGIDHRTDIWAMGVILYETLSGQKPFSGDTIFAILNQICNEPFPPPRAINRAVPAALEEVILRAMSRNVSERFDSAEEMSRALCLAMKKSHVGSGVRVSSPTVFSETLPSVSPEESSGESPPLSGNPEVTPSPEATLTRAESTAASSGSRSDAGLSPSRTDGIGVPVARAAKEMAPTARGKPWRRVAFFVVLAASLLAFLSVAMFREEPRLSPISLPVETPAPPPDGHLRIVSNPGQGKASLPESSSRENGPPTPADQKGQSGQDTPPRDKTTPTAKQSGSETASKTDLERNPTSAKQSPLRPSSPRSVKKDNPSSREKTDRPIKGRFKTEIYPEYE